MARTNIRKKREDGGLSGARFAVNCFVGAVVGLLAAIGLLLVFSILISKEAIPESMMPAVTLLTCFIGSLIGALVTIAKNRKMSLLSGAAEGLMFFLLTLLCGLFTGSGSHLGELTPGLLAAELAGGVLTGVFKATRRKKRI